MSMEGFSRSHASDRRQCSSATTLRKRFGDGRRSRPRAPNPLLQLRLHAWVPTRARRDRPESPLTRALSAASVRHRSRSDVPILPGSRRRADAKSSALRRGAARRRGVGKLMRIPERDAPYTRSGGPRAGPRRALWSEACPVAELTDRSTVRPARRRARIRQAPRRAELPRESEQAPPGGASPLPALLADGLASPGRRRDACFRAAVSDSTGQRSAGDPTRSDRLGAVLQIGAAPPPYHCREMTPRLHPLHGGPNGLHKDLP